MTATVSAHEGTECRQITFLHAYRDLASFRGESTFLTWLMQIAINVCMTHLRAKQARRSWHETIETPQLGYRDIWEPAGAERPDEALNRKEYHQILEDCIAKLPQQYHNAVRMRFVQDRSYVEISSALGVPMGTLKTWLYRARRQLQEILNDTEFRAM